MAIVNCTVEELVFNEEPKHFNFKDLTGKRSGRLLVLGPIKEKPKKGCWDWYCLCDCGNISVVNGAHLSHSWTKSCGCVGKQAFIERFTKHGRTETPEYRIYCKIKERCCNPDCKSYPKYGGRGIKLCLTFEEFFEEVGERPGPNFSIDRINNEAHYERNNIRWATAQEQANNRRSTLYLTIRGQTKSCSTWAEESGLQYLTLYNRIKNLGWCNECAIQKPLNARKPKDCPNCNKP